MPTWTRHLRSLLLDRIARLALMTVLTRSLAIYRATKEWRSWSLAATPEPSGEACGKSEPPFIRGDDEHSIERGKGHSGHCRSGKNLLCRSEPTGLVQICSRG